MDTTKDFVLYVLFILTILAVWTHYKDPEGITILGKLIATIIK